MKVSQEPGDEKGRGAKGKGESYFWLLSRKSNLRSLTPKELQMHGRQHTGVSIYEARTGTREKDERSCRNDGEAAVETTDGEIRIRQKERERGGGEESARETKIRRWKMLRREPRRESSTTMGLSRPLPIIFVPKPVSSTPDADPLLES